MQRFQPNWSVKPSAIAGGLVSEAVSASRWTGQSSVQRLQADWAAKHAVIAGGLFSGACIVFGGDWSAYRASLAGGLVSRKYRRA